MKTMKFIKMILILTTLLQSSTLEAQWSLTGNSGTNNANFIGTTDYNPLKLRTNNLERMSITQDGFVNIGPTPIFGSVGVGSFAVNANIGNWAGMNCNGTTSSTRPFYGYAVNGGQIAMHYYDVSSESWRLRMLGSDRLTVTQFGLVGIGTTSPTEMLDVTGNAKFSGIVSSNFFFSTGGAAFTGTVSAGQLACQNINVNVGVVADAVTSSTVTVNDINPNIQFGTVTMNGDLVVNGGSNIATAGQISAGKIYGNTYDSGPAVTGTAFFDPNNHYFNSMGVFGSDGTPNGYDDRRYSYAIYSHGNTRVAGDIECSGGLFGISDKQFKTNIKEINHIMERIKKLTPIEYEYKKDSLYERFNFPNKVDHGFIAQELEKVFPSLVIEKTQPVDILKPDGEKLTYKMVNYVGLIPFLTKGIQEQQTMIEEQNNLINQLNEDVKYLNQRLQKIEESMDRMNGDNTPSINSNNLEQPNQLQVNNPNPTDKHTEIRYYVSPNSILASIFVMDMNGQVLKTIELTQVGEGSITIQTDAMTAGIYNYILFVDGSVVDSKKMIVIH